MLMMHKPRIRTITLGVEDAHPLTAGQVARAADILQRARQRFNDAGYEVQTVRISTRAVFDDLADRSDGELLAYARELQGMLDDVEIGYCSLGPAQAARPAFPLARIELIPDLLAATGSINLTVQLADREHRPRAEAALPIARVMKRLANETSEGFGNFNFAMLACVAPGTPFFPAAYHNGPASLSIGLQGASIVKDALRPYASGNAPTRITEWVREALIARAMPEAYGRR